jgi:predicted DNA-binding transcriptional regulator AlpA
MKGTERVRKFNEFKKLHHAGHLRSSEIVKKLGISKNTFYNWQKRLHGTVTGSKTVHVREDSAFPSFTKIIPQTGVVSPVSHAIEIAVGSTMVIRIPEALLQQSLRQVFTAIEQCSSHQ